MKLKGVIYVLAALVIGLFVVANLALLMGSVELNLLFVRADVPLAMVLLIVAGIILLLDLAVHASGESERIRERRAMVKDLEIARLRVEKEEESRTGALRIALERDLGAIRAQLERVLAGQSALLDRRPIVESAEPVNAPEAFEPELVPARDAARLARIKS